MRVSFPRFLVTSALVAAAINAVSNAAYTYALWHDWSSITLSGTNAIAGDLTLTPVFIGLLSVLLGTEATRRKLWNGKVSAPTTRAAHRLAAVLPQGTVMRAMAVACVCAVLLGLPIGGMLTLIGSANLSLGKAVLAKVVLTVVCSLIIVPAVTLAAAGDLSWRPGLRLY